VAVKVFDLGQVRDWKAFELFERECQVLRSIDHDQIPRYYEDFADEKAGRYYLVMELIEGRSLAQDIENTRRRNTQELADLLRQLLGVLEYLHDLHPRVIHRDIKPGNVIVRDDGRAVLVDFGAVAQPFREKGGSTMIGSFGYMAPEQLHGDSGPRTDLYALGATIAAVAAATDGESLPRRGLRIDLPKIFDPGPLGFTHAAMLEPPRPRRRVRCSTRRHRPPCRTRPFRPRCSRARCARRRRSRTSWGSCRWTRRRRPSSRPRCHGCSGEWSPRPCSASSPARRCCSSSA
jgi:serine/threonine protein kinase